MAPDYTRGHSVRSVVFKELEALVPARQPSAQHQSRAEVNFAIGQGRRDDRRPHDYELRLNPFLRKKSFFPGHDGGKITYRGTGNTDAHGTGPHCG